MNSDPTGNFTVMGMSVAMSISSRLEDSYNSTILSGFINFFDAYLGGERDPYKLLSIFGNGFSSGMLIGLGLGFMSMIGNMACSMPVAAVTAKVFMGIIAGIGLVGSAQGMCQSFAKGEDLQGWLRAVLTGFSAYGCYKTWNSAFNTATNIKNGATCFDVGILVLTED